MAHLVTNWNAHRPEIDAYVKDESNKMPAPMYSKLFDVETTPMLESTEFGWSGFGPMVEVGEMGDSVEDESKEGYSYTFVRRAYRKHAVFSSDLAETGQSLKIEQIARDLPRTLMYTRELNVFGMLRNAFNPLYTWGDGKTLASVAHPLKNGSGTQANTFSDGVQLPLDLENVKILQDVMYNMVSNSGNLLNIGEKPILFFTPNNRVKAFEIAESDLKSAENEKNYWKGNLYDLMEIPWMKYEAAKQAGEITAAKSSSSNFYDSMWGLIDPTLAKKYFKVKIASGYAKYTDKVREQNQALVKYAYDKYTWGTTGYYPIVISKGDNSTYAG